MITFAPKPGDAVRECVWIPLPGTSVSSLTATVATGTATVTTRTDGQQAIVIVTGGVEGVTQILNLTATMSDSQVITETAYILIAAPEIALTSTARDVVAYALRRVTGIAEDPDAEQEADALERLSDMLAAWKGQGADVGVVLPLTASTSLKVDDAVLQGIKANLILALADIYPFEVSPIVIKQASNGLAFIKNARLADRRQQAAYF